MNSFRFARAALRARPAAMRVPVQRRTYAEAVPDKASRPVQACVPLRQLTSSADQAQPFSPPSGTQLMVSFPNCLALDIAEPLHDQFSPDHRSAIDDQKLITANHSPSTSPRMSSRSTSRPSLARWVSSRTTFPRLSSSSPVWWRLLRRAVAPSSSSVRPRPSPTTTIGDSN